MFECVALSYKIYGFRCKQQLVSFLASSIVQPDVFGASSQNSLAEFYNLLMDESTPNFLIKDIIDELINQSALQEVRKIASTSSTDIIIASL